MTTIGNAIAASILTVAAVSAQLVIPSALNGIEGGSASLIPFGLSGPVRYQCLYDGDQLPFSGPRMISQVAFRADWNNGLEIPAKQFLRVDIEMSTSAVQSDRASTNFDANHGVDRQFVASFLQVALPLQPAFAPGAAGPRPATVVLMLQQPFWYGLTPVRSGPVPATLVVDLHITSQPSGAYRLDSPFTCDSQITQFGSNMNCMTAALQQVTIVSSNDIRAAGTVTWSVANMPPSVPFAVNVAFDQSGQWAAFDAAGNPVGIVSLPALLHPSAVGCYVDVRMDLLQFGGISGAAGSGSASLSLPSDRSIVGQNFFAQAVVRDIVANSFGHVTSLGTRSTICGPLGCARVYQIGDASATTGSVTFGAASVIEVQ